MRKFLMIAAAACCLVACNKDKEMSADEQKQQLQNISDELNSIVDTKSFEDIKTISNYYNETLSGYNTVAISARCGNIMGLTEGFFSPLPATKSIEWSFTTGNAVFEANATLHLWEYKGEGDKDGIYLKFVDNLGRECTIRITAKNEYTGILKGEREATVELFLGDTKIAGSSATCVSNGITDLTAGIDVSYGPVKSITALTAKNGEYGVHESVTYDGRQIASCVVNAGGVSFTEADVVSGFGHIDAEVDVLGKLKVTVNCKASIPDLFLSNPDKDYVTKLQEYIDENVDVNVLFNNGAAQAEVRLKVQNTGAPLFGKVEVVPYIYFESDGSSSEFSTYFQATSCLPDIIRHIEDMLGNIDIVL